MRLLLSIRRTPNVRVLTAQQERHEQGVGGCIPYQKDIEYEHDDEDMIKDLGNRIQV